VNIQFSLGLLVSAAALTGCLEGATTVIKTVHNDTDQTLELVLDLQDVWDSTSTFILAPDERHDIFAMDTRGKCHDCSMYEDGALFVDSLRLIAPETGWQAGFSSTSSGRWESTHDEGWSWIRFEHVFQIHSSDLQ